MVESSHCPTISFFRVVASCARAGDAIAATQQRAQQRNDPKNVHQRPLTGVSATGVSGGLPANQDLRLSTTS